MATDRRRQILLGALVVVLGAIVFRVWDPLALGIASRASSTSTTTATTSTTSQGAGSSSNPVRGTAPPGRPGQTGAMTAPDVHLNALEGDRPKPVDAQRNLFRFKPKPAPVAAARTAQVVAPVAPLAPPGPPPLPPIPLKFIGTVRPGRMTIAVLSDGVGQPMYGKEGDTIAGRYRILRIGVESIEMSYLDGQGRQTIRLTGS
jgi:hypothetical protein